MTDKDLEKKIKEEKLVKLIATVVLIGAPLLGSIVSSFHVFDFLMLFMQGWMSFTIAFTYELMNLAILFAIIVLPNYKSAWIWTSFVFILFIQFLGNVYYVFQFLRSNMSVDEEWGQYLFTLSQQFGNWYDKIGALMSGKEWVSTPIDVDNTALIYAIIIGVMVPAVSLMMIKAASGFLNTAANTGSASSLDDQRREREETDAKWMDFITQVQGKIDEQNEGVDTKFEEIEKDLDNHKEKVMDGIKLTVEEKSKEFDAINANLQERLDKLSDTSDKLSIKS